MKQVVIQNETSRTHLKGSNVRGGPITTSDIDVRGLVKELRAHLDGEVRFDVAQVIQMAMSEGQEEPSRAYPEAAYTQSPVPLKATMRKAAYIVVGAGLLLAGGTWMGRFIGKKRSSKPFF